MVVAEMEAFLFVDAEAIEPGIGARNDKKACWRRNAICCILPSMKPAGALVEKKAMWRICFSWNSIDLSWVAMAEDDGWPKKDDMIMAREADLQDAFANFRRDFRADKIVGAFVSMNGDLKAVPSM